MPPTSYGSIYDLAHEFAAPVFAEACDKKHVVLFSIFPGYVLGEGSNTAEIFVSRVLAKQGFKMPAWSDHARAASLPVRTITVTDHFNKLVQHIDADSLLCDLGTIRHDRRQITEALTYDTMLANGAFIFDFSARHPSSDQRFIELGRVTAKDGKSASALIARAMTSKVFHTGAEVTPAKIIMRMCGTTTTWTANARSGKWKGKGPFAVLRADD